MYFYAYISDHMLWFIELTSKYSSETWTSISITIIIFAVVSQ